MAAREFQYGSLNAALSVYYGGKVGQASHCALADPGRIRGHVDPDAGNARMAEIGMCLNAVSEEGRVALELETLYPDMPIRRSNQPKRKAATRGYRKQTETERSKSDVMAQAFGGSWYESKYLRVVRQAREEATFQAARRGLIPPPSWFDDEKHARGVA